MGGGSDLLDGGPGADTMRGDGGNDVYVVNRPEDVVEEAPGVGGGTDTVFAAVDFTLPDDVENLRLVGWQVWNAVGNGLDNVITGSEGIEQLFGLGGDDALYGKAGNDALDGGAGADYMDGGEGDDVFEVDDAGDVAFERVGGARGGHDVVRASVDYTLGNQVEELTLLGNARVGIGNGWANRIVGNVGDNRLVGWGGDDCLEGGAGRDRLNGGAGNDTAVFIPPFESPHELYDVPRVIADLDAGTMRWELSSEPADQLISIESIATGAGYDRITGSDGVISPGWGANLVDAGGGNDVIHGGSCQASAFSRANPGTHPVARSSEVGLETT